MPTPGQLQDAVAARLSGVLLFSCDLTNDEKSLCVELVQSALPRARVEGIAPIHGFDRVRFRRVLSRDEIISHAHELMRAAREFTRLASDLHSLDVDEGDAGTRFTFARFGARAGLSGATG